MENLMHVAVTLLTSGALIALFGAVEAWGKRYLAKNR